jgi:hypothetical protein
MLLSTRDEQRKRQAAHILVAIGTTQRLSLTGTDNAGYRADSVSDPRAPSLKPSRVDIQSREPSITVDVSEEQITTHSTKETTSPPKKRYH